MSLYKRGRVYWYSFIWNGEHVQESTRTRNAKAAADIEAAHRVRLARGEAGVLEKKRQPIQTLAEFIDAKFLPWAQTTFADKQKTWLFYRNGARRLKEFAELSSCTLDQINGEKISGYIAHRQRAKLTVTSINRELQVLRRCLHLALEWGLIPTVIKIRMQGGEAKRERVITAADEARYLAAAVEPLASIATMLVDSGMRPEECFRLKWESITWTNGRYGTFLVTHGKTAAARRMLPMSARVRALLEKQWNEMEKPIDGWIWPAPTRSGHVEPSTLKKQHAKTFTVIAEQGAKNKLKPVRPFVLYSLRHTFLTRLGESGCDAWTLARIAGHSSIAISARYVHPSDNAVHTALDRLNEPGLLVQ